MFMSNIWPTNEEDIAISVGKTISNSPQYSVPELQPTQLKNNVNIMGEKTFTSFFSITAY
jgi:hypothetical protein